MACEVDWILDSLRQCHSRYGDRADLAQSDRDFGSPGYLMPSWDSLYFLIGNH